MKARLKKTLGDVADDIYTSTFHALSLNILRKFGKGIGYSPNISVLDEDDQLSLMAQCARQLGYEMKKEEIKRIAYMCSDSREKMKTGSRFDLSFNNASHSKIANEYIDRLRKNNQIDFTGILTEAIRLLETDKQVCQKLMRRFEMLQVDEAQDCNKAQHHLVRLLGGHGNVFMVGDRNQSIYKFRGASPESIEEFIKEHNADIIELPVNYRSTPEIVNAASKLIRRNEGQSNVKISTVNKSGTPIIWKEAQTPDYEGMWIAKQICYLIDNQGYKPNDFAVLYRANAMSRAIEQAFVSNGLPYSIIGGFGFFDRVEIKDALAMLRFYSNPADGTALSRFINKPARSIGQVTLGKIENYANDNNVNMIESLNSADKYLKSTAKSNVIKDHCQSISNIFSKDRSNQDIGTIIKDMINETGYESYLEVKYEDDADNKKSNLNELINSASIYSKQNGTNVSDYLGKIALMSTADKDSDEGAISMMTVHASKGLEFPVVFLPRLEEGQMPHTRCFSEEGGLAEERRLCYVAITRAEKILVTSWSKEMRINTKYGLRTKKNEPSRFLFESGILSKEDLYE